MEEALVANDEQVVELLGLLSRWREHVQLVSTWKRLGDSRCSLVSVESHCPKLLWRDQPDGDLVAAAGGNKRGRSDHR